MFQLGMSTNSLDNEVKHLMKTSIRKLFVMPTNPYTDWDLLTGRGLAHPCPSCPLDVLHFLPVQHSFLSVSVSYF